MKRPNVRILSLLLASALVPACGGGGGGGGAGGPPGAFDLVSPADLSADVTIVPTLTWTDAGGETSYTVQIHTDATFSAPLTYETTGLAAGTTRFTVPGATLATGTTYFWRVIAVNGQGTTTAANAPFQFTTANAPPTAFTLSTPTDAATGVSLTPTLTWTDSTGEDSYTVQIDTENTFSNPLTYETTTAPADTTQFDIPPGTLASATQYFWRVIAVNTLGTTTASNAPFSFTTGAVTPPGAFTLVAPADGATNVLNTPILSWTDSAGEDSYTVQIATDNGFAVIVYENAAIAADTTSHSVPAGNLAGTTTYFWRVIALNGNSSTTASNAPFSFTTGAAPSAFTLVSPADGATNVNVRPTLTWTDATGEAGYLIEIDTDATFSSPVVQQVRPQNTTSYTLTVPQSLDAATTYFWRVIATSGTGSTVASNAPFSFTTQ